MINESDLYIYIYIYIIYLSRRSVGWKRMAAADLSLIFGLEVGPMIGRRMRSVTESDRANSTAISAI